MNIVHIYPGVLRMHGATKWLLLFATELSKKSSHNTIACVNFDIPIPYWFEGDIKPLFRSEPNKKRKREYVGLEKLLSMFLQTLAVFCLPMFIPRNTDVMVLHSELSLFAIVLGRMRFRGSKIIYYCYQPPRELYDLRNYARRTYGMWFSLLNPFFEVYKIIDKSLVGKSDCVFVWSEQSRDYAKSIYGDVAFEIVPAGVDFSTFDLNTSSWDRINELRQELDLIDKNILIMNSALTKKKNIPTFLRLVNRLKKKRYPVRGLIIGEGPEQKVLRRMIDELRISEDVHLLGYVSQEDLPLYYHISDILYFLEPDGAWTMSTIEAGAAKKPVIVAPGGSMTKLVADGETGFVLTDIGNENILFEYTEYLLGNPESSRKMGFKNYFYSKQFSAEKSAEKFLEIVNTNPA